MGGKQIDEDVIFKVYCDNCEKDTTAISLNLLKAAKRVEVSCPQCGSQIVYVYDVYGNQVRIFKP